MNGDGFNPNEGWTYYRPGGGGGEGGRFGNRDNPLNPFTGEAGTRDQPISLAWGPSGGHRFGEMQFLGGPFGWGRWEDFGPGVGHGDIAVGGRYGRMAKQGFMPRLFQSGGNMMRRGGDFFGGQDRADRYWGRGQDMPGFTGQPEGVPYYGEGSRMSQTLGPLLESAWGGGDGGGGGGGGGDRQLTGAEIRNRIASNFQGNPQASLNAWDYINPLPFGGSKGAGPGSGDPTLLGIGKAAGTAGNLVFPGLGLLTRPAAMLFWKLVSGGMGKNQALQTAQKQAGQMSKYDKNFAYGGMPRTTPGGGGAYDPFGGLPEGFKQSNRMGRLMGGPQSDINSPGGYGNFGSYGAPTFTGPGSFGPQFSGGSIFSSRTNLGMALPGSFTNLGGSAHALGEQVPMWSRMQMRQARQPGGVGGGDAVMQFARQMGPINYQQMHMTAPGGGWGGGGFGGGGGGPRFGPNQRRMSQE